MTPWSQSEARRTIDEVKRRSQMDPVFRALALSDPMAALLKVNPRPMPVGLIRFVEAGVGADSVIDSKIILVTLPEPSTSSDECSDEDLEDVAGGSSGTPPASPPPPPVGLS